VTWIQYRPFINVIATGGGVDNEPVTVDIPGRGRLTEVYARNPEAAKQLNLLWLSCGSKDGLIHIGQKSMSTLGNTTFRICGMLPITDMMRRNGSRRCISSYNNFSSNSMPDALICGFKI
jgi:hypothetical protein